MNPIQERPEYYNPSFDEKDQPVNNFEKLPAELIVEIFSYLSEKELSRSCDRVCKDWYRLSHDKSLYIGLKGRIGKKEIEKTLKVKVGPEPRRPRNYRIKDGEMFVMIPATINEIPFTRELMGEKVSQIIASEQKLAQIPREINKLGYNYLTEDIVELDKIGVSYWVAMKRQVIGREESYEKQEELIKKYDANYSHPRLDEAIVCIFMERLISGTSSFGQAPWTFTRVEEKIKNYEKSHVVVGGFGSRGLDVDSYYFFDYDSFGAAPLRRFFLGT